MKKSFKKVVVAPVTFSALNVVESAQENKKLDLLAVQLNASESKAQQIEKNIKARIRNIETFRNASELSLNGIVQYSDSATLEYLLNPANYKTASRILDYANKMNGVAKYPVVIDAVERALKQIPEQRISIAMLCGRSGQCEARVKNVLKALYFFDRIFIHNSRFAGKWVLSLDKDVTIQLRTE